MKSDCDTHNDMMDLETALTRLRGRITPVAGSEQLAVRDTLGRVLAEPVRSPINVPGHTNSAMDGYAVRGADLPASGSATLTVIGTSFAGQPFAGTVAAGQAVRIMTGAVVPEGSDTVIMQEHVTRDGDTITLESGHSAGQNVRHPGEDVAAGAVVLEAGKRIAPPELGLLASLGVPEVRVRRRPRVAFFSTGDELKPLGQPLAEGEIYDSNRYTLHGMLRRLNVELLDMGIIPDDRDAIADAFTQAAAAADAVITSGGVSVGEADFVKETLDKLGEIDFWKIAMKPGKPLAFGRLGDALFFGLPGNPVSAMATFYQVVQPALEQLAGAEAAPRLRFTVRTTERLKKRPGRQDFQRGILEYDAQGQLTVRATGHQGSHVLTSMSRANCFIILERERGNVEAGEEVVVEPFAGVI